ncbi:MAG: 2-dehydropantoate 2-reductase N-terminal domain-containing protein [Gammaproteobacteria bacterium]
MQIHIIGAGGIGIVVTWALSEAGLDVVLVEQHAAKLAAGQRDGISVAGRGRKKIPMLVFSDWQPVSNSIVLLCTKTYDNPEIIQRLQTSSAGNIQLIPIQNGFDTALDALTHAGEAIASFVSECERDQPLTRITRPGDLHIGARHTLTATEQTAFDQCLDLLVPALAQADLFSVKQVPDIRPYKAAKLMYNAAISPLAASAGVDNAALLSNPQAKRYFFGLLQENHAILKQAGVPLAKIGPFHPDNVVRILRTPGLATLLGHFFKPSLHGTYCSMAPDIGTEHTEIDAYNGYLVKLAGNFPCPLNRAAVTLVKRMTSERLQPHPCRLQTFAELLELAA